MLLEKHVPTPEELESHFALELPDRETLALIVIRNVLNGLHVKIDVKNNNIAVQICAVVNALSAVGVDFLHCNVVQK